MSHAGSNQLAESYGGGSQHYPTRPVDKDKAEQELAQNIKKATNADETAPKAKHVRKCIVYTWDYHTSASIWSGLRVLPILSDEIQTYKALITVHKVLQEGHPIVLKEAQNQTGWLETCARTVGSDGQRGYGVLIRAYVSLVLDKIRFHRNHRDFNGQFEYEEYVSLRNIDDPNEGYEAISDLMNLQDRIDSFQKLVFAHFRGSTNNECRISSLVPLVVESWGIYRFITSMMRAMHRRTDAMDALEPLRARFGAQHHNLRKFYYECSNLRYLTSLINVPKLPHDPPNLTDPGNAPDLPKRPTAPKSPSPPPREPSADINEQARMLKEFEDKKAEQARLQAEREADAKRLAELQAQQQRDFESQQAAQAQREREALEALQRQQLAGHEAGRTAELEREILAMRGQYERDQMMLEQYDRRVKALEMELAGIQQNIAAQLHSKDDMARSLQDQVTLWRNKYEALAKLYSQLRKEHLDMLAKYKAMQLKANSAQESIDKMERMERDVKSKNLELADMIRERDRARFEVDRLKSVCKISKISSSTMVQSTQAQKEELERLRRDLRFAEERAEDAARSKQSDMSGVLSKYNRQINDLEDSLSKKQGRIDDLLSRIDGHQGEIDRVRQEKDQEIEILTSGMDEAVNKLGTLQLGQGEADEALQVQIEHLVLEQQKRLNQILDSIFQACIAKIDDSIYELESPIQQGNQTATAAYTLSTVEQATTAAMDFSAAFSAYLGGEKGGDHVEVIKAANNLAQATADVLVNTKGICRLAPDDDAADKLVQKGKPAGDAVIRAFLSLQSYRLQDKPLPARRQDVMLHNETARSALAALAKTIESVLPSTTARGLATANGDIGDVVEREMLAAARAIEMATKRLEALMARPKDTSRYSAVDLQVHDAILEAAMAITSSIARLIKAATDSQQEIVASGRAGGSAQAFYKKNSRWTEGLISAAKAVAWATTQLIEVADGVVSGSRTLEELIVASNEVAAATAQLVQASRVKADHTSKTQERLEVAARTVTEACKALVKQVRTITERRAKADGDGIDYSGMGTHDFKRREFEQQVQILTLEKDLTNARRGLADLRRHGYHEDGV